LRLVKIKLVTQIVLKVQEARKSVVDDILTINLHFFNVTQFRTTFKNAL